VSWPCPSNVRAATSCRRAFCTVALPLVRVVALRHCSSAYHPDRTGPAGAFGHVHVFAVFVGSDVLAAQLLFDLGWLQQPLAAVLIVRHYYRCAFPTTTKWCLRGRPCKVLSSMQHLQGTSLRLLLLCCLLFCRACIALKWEACIASASNPASMQFVQTQTTSESHTSKDRDRFKCLACLLHNWKLPASHDLH
jgi:hypothetical protein